MLSALLPNLHVVMNILEALYSGSLIRACLNGCILNGMQGRQAWPRTLPKGGLHQTERATRLG